MAKNKDVKEFKKRVGEIESVRNISLESVLMGVEEWRNKIMVKYAEIEEKERRGEILDGQEIINASYYSGLLEGLSYCVNNFGLVGKKGKRIRR